MSISSYLKRVKKVFSLSLLSLITGLITLLILPNYALAQTAYRGELTLTQGCSATTSIRNARNPISLNAGETYTVSGLNRDNNPTHAFIVVADNGRRWVSLTCGTLNPSVVINTPAPGTPSRTGFIPFFDNNPNSPLNRDRIDVAPLARPLNDFDIAINELCSTPGTVVSRRDFQATLNRFPEVLANIKAEVEGSILTGRTSDEEFLGDLTDIWFNVQGFDHVFCGEPGRNIGGLHFAGRYLDLQEKGLAGILPRSIDNAEVVEGVIYTIGVVMQVGDRRVSSPIKGYAYTLNAEEILAKGSKVYKDNPNPGSTNQACLVSLTDEGATFENVFVAREGGIRTFYSDASPDFRRNPRCDVS